uniref:CYP79A122 n=1 Tax=Amentotaxus argotaenia TaxID=25625 RepID=A0A288W885_AMEAR|nr:CYP79A122 [Amentotaxus argotaenia]
MALDLLITFMPTMFNLHSRNLNVAGVFFISITIIIVSAFLLQLRKKQLPLPPGPPRWPVVGNIPELLFNGSASKWLHSLLHKHASPIVCVRLGAIHVIVINSPKIAREIVKEKDEIFASRPLTIGTNYCSRGHLSTAHAQWGAQWKKMRRVVAFELLSPARHKWLQGKRMEEADNLLHYIWKQCQHSTSPPLVNIRNVARQYTGNVMRKLIFNTRYFGTGPAKQDGGPGPEEEEHVEALFRVLALEYNICVSDYLPALRWLDIGGEEKEMIKWVNVVDKHHTPPIEERFNLKRGSLSSSAQSPEDLLDILISAEDVEGAPLLTLEDVKAQVADLFYAGVDNSSYAVEWALAEMLIQPQIMLKAMKEIDLEVGKERLVEESDISKLNYVKACAKEALRLYPLSPFNLPHMSMENTTLAGYHIPKGSHVLLSRMEMGRNPQVWEDPLRFCPDRFMKDDGLLVDFGEPELRFISFGAGRRGCIGTLLGISMTMMLLVRLLQGFNWSLPPHGTVHLDLDLALTYPLHALPTPRLSHHLYPK